MKRKIFQIALMVSLTAVVVFVVFFAHSVLATNYVPLANLPNMPNINPEDASSLGVYIGYLIPLFIGICAILAVVMIVIGGLQYMTNELVSAKNAGKEKIKNAITGLLLALAAWLILYTINPNILSVDFSSLKSQPAGTP